MELYYNGDNIAAVLENNNWINFWDDDVETEIEFTYQDYEETDRVFEYLKSSGLDYLNDDDFDKINVILQDKVTDLIKNHMNILKKIISYLLILFYLS